MVTRNQVLHLLVPVVVVVIVGLLTIWLLKPSVQTKEAFQGAPSTLNDPAETYQRNNYAPQKCSILLSKGPEIGNREYDIMNSVIHGHRLNEWKPLPTDPMVNTHKRTDREYCYMYNDSSNNIQDFNLQAQMGQCDKSNPMFKDSALITNVFSNSALDQSHVMPVQKCVLEIDPAQASSDEINLLWRSWANSHCDNISGTLRHELVKAQDKLQHLKQDMTVLKAADATLRTQRTQIDQDLAFCGTCNVSWSNLYHAQTQNYMTTQESLFDTQAISQSLYDSNQFILNDNKRLGDDWRSTNTLNINETQKRNTCQTDLHTCTLDREFAEFRYNESYKVYEELSGVFNHLTSDVQTLEKDTKTVSEANVRCTNELNRVTPLRDNTLRDLTILKDNANKCSIDRHVVEEEYKKEALRLKDITTKADTCRGERKKVEQDYNTLINNMSACRSHLAQQSYNLTVIDKSIQIETKVKEKAEDEYNAMRKNHEQCLVASTKNEETIKSLRQTNIQIYNDLEKNKTVNQQMVDVAIKELNDSMECATNKAVDQIKKEMEINDRNLCKVKSDKYQELAELEKQIAMAELDKKAALTSCSTCRPSVKQCVAQHLKNPMLCPDKPYWSVTMWQDDNYKGNKKTISIYNYKNSGFDMTKAGTDYYMGWVPFGISSYTMTQMNGEFEFWIYPGVDAGGEDTSHRGTGAKSMGNIDAKSMRIHKKPYPAESVTNAQK